MKFMLKAPGIKRLRLKYVESLSIFAFNFNVHRYAVVSNSGRLLEFENGAEIDAAQAGAS
jgi:hypothetical protein